MKEEIKLKVGQKCRMLFEKYGVDKDKLVTIKSIEKCSNYVDDTTTECCQLCRRRVILEGVPYNARNEYCWGNTNLRYALQPINNTMKDLVGD